VHRHRALRSLAATSALTVTAVAGVAGITAGAAADPGQGKGNPPGNNGTVKIAPHGEMDGIPQNTPHVGCEFQVEWYGYDEGDDIISNVAFAMHAPTKDVGLGVEGPEEVFVGGDPATGAGTETGQDGVEVYTLSFEGEPHPQQGYHVKLTVTTPYSHGNDTKTKVFWVEGCEDEAPTSTTSVPETTETTETAGTETTETAGTQTTETAGTETTATVPVAETTATATADLEVAGEQAAEQVQAEQADVPSGVAAGAAGDDPALSATAGLALPVVFGLGLLLTLAGVLTRRRRA